MHKFYKTSSNTSGLPSRTTNQTWERITKKAHDVWNIESRNGQPVVNRIRAENVETNEPGHGEDEPLHAHPEMDDERGPHLDSGDLVLLFMGGQKIAGRISKIGSKSVTVATDSNMIDVPIEWMEHAIISKVAQDQPADEGAPAAAPPQGPSPARAQSTQALTKMVQSNGGHALVSLGMGENGQQDMAEITQDASGGIVVKMIQLVPQVYHTGKYSSIAEFVQDMSIESAGLQLISPGKSVK